MDRFFSLFGKIVLVLLVLAVIAGGGFYAGRRLTQTNEPEEETPPQPQRETSETPPTPTSTVPTRTIQGGVPKSAGLVFDLYTIEVPTDWSVNRETGPGTDIMSERLKISNGEYEIWIFQAATGGALCLYPGDPDFEGPSARYDNFVVLTTADGRVLRRSGSNTPGPGAKTGFTLCQQTPEGDFNQPTMYGHISYSLPKSFDEAILTEMDRTISSLTAR